MRTHKQFHAIQIAKVTVNALLMKTRDHRRRGLAFFKVSVPRLLEMYVLIVESNPELGRVWRRHLQRQGAHVTIAESQEAAILALYGTAFDIIVLDLVLESGSALAVADFASYRRPNARVIFVTNTTFFSDGSIFAHSPNACAYVQSATPPEDLAAMVQHYAAER